jgi:uncharacterized membrane protein YesL
MEEWPVPLRVIGQALTDWWDDWVQMVTVNLVWILAWLTVVLGPPATLGLLYVTNRLAHGEGVGLGGLLEGGRRYFLKAWLWMLLNLVGTFIVGANIWFYAQFETVWAWFLRLFFLLLGLLWLVVQFYALPYLMEQEQKSLGLALRNGLFTALAAPGYTLVVAGAAGLVGLLSVMWVAPLFLGGPCLIGALGNRAVLERLETYRVREREAAWEKGETGGS